MMRSHLVLDVLLDCGCTITPPVASQGTAQQGALIVCPGHNLRHALDLAEEVTTFVYTSKRLDPPDPETETADGVVVVIPGG